MFRVAQYFIMIPFPVYWGAVLSNILAQILPHSGPTWEFQLCLKSCKMQVGPRSGTIITEPPTRQPNLKIQIHAFYNLWITVGVSRECLQIVCKVSVSGGCLECVLLCQSPPFMSVPTYYVCPHLLFCISLSPTQGGDSSAGTQALPVGKIIETKVCRKDNLKVSQICICLRKLSVRK